MKIDYDSHAFKIIVGLLVWVSVMVFGYYLNRGDNSGPCDEYKKPSYSHIEFEGCLAEYERDLRPF